MPQLSNTMCNMKSQINLASALSFLLVVSTCFVCVANNASATHAQEVEEFQFPCRDGYKLDGKIQTPSAEQLGEDPQRVIILNHGSGQHSMDQDLTVVTRNGAENLFFRDIADSLVHAGFTVIRYNKRSYQVQQQFATDPTIREDEGVKAFVANPLKYFVDDCLDCVTFAKEKFPEAEIYLLGHSVGTYVSIQAAAQDEDVRGVALLGFYATSIEYLLFEQHIARPARQFAALDSNHDGQLNDEELNVETDLAKALVAQRALLDLDKDGQLSVSEFQAASLSSLFMGGTLKAVDFRKQEEAYPRVTAVLKDAHFKAAFFQGTWDNQTPVYNTQAVELLAKNAWNKDYRFHYFPKLGHALDERSDYTDNSYGLIDAAALQALTVELDEYFR